jgi:hypothetical protein
MPCPTASDSLKKPQTSGLDTNRRHERCGPRAAGKAHRTYTSKRLTVRDVRFNPDFPLEHAPGVTFGRSALAPGLELRGEWKVWVQPKKKAQAFQRCAARYTRSCNGLEARFG